MAKKNQPVEEIEVIDSGELDLEDLEIEGMEIVDDEVEQELTQPAPKGKVKEEKAPRKAPSGSNLPSVQPLADGEVGAAYIAEICGVDAREIRGFLRANFRDMDETKGQRYRFQKDDPIIQEIADAFKAHKNTPKATPAPKAAAPVAAKPAAAPVKPAVAQATKPVAAKPAPVAPAAPAKRKI